MGRIKAKDKLTKLREHFDALSATHVTLPEEDCKKEKLNEVRVSE